MHNCIDFHTELDDGTFVTTSNVQSAGAMTSPPSVDREMYPYEHRSSCCLNGIQRVWRRVLQLAAYAQSSSNRSMSCCDRTRGCMSRRACIARTSAGSHVRSCVACP